MEKGPHLLPQLYKGPNSKCPFPVRGKFVQQTEVVDLLTDKLIKSQRVSYNVTIVDKDTVAVYVSAIAPKNYEIQLFVDEIIYETWLTPTYATHDPTLLSYFTDCALGKMPDFGSLGRKIVTANLLNEKEDVIDTQTWTIEYEY